jgi:hypothetical protein
MTWSRGFELVMMVLASPLVAMVVPLLWQELQKRNLQRSVAYGKLAIQFATEERAKAKDLGRELTSAETLKLAVGFMVDHMGTVPVVGTTPAKADAMVHALLPESSEGAASAAAQAIAGVSVPFGQAAQ